MLQLYRAYQDQRQAVLALADRLSRDPFLGESVHRILTDVTSIRSASEILQAGDALDPADRARFRAIIGGEQRRARRDRPLARRLLRQRQHPRPLGHRRPSSSTPSSSRPTTTSPSSRRWRPTLGPPEAAGAEPAWADAPLETRRFHRLEVRAREVAGDAVAAIVAAHPALATDEARAQAASALHAYVAGAALMPYEPFLEAAERSRYDIDALSRAVRRLLRAGGAPAGDAAPPRRRGGPLRLHALGRLGLRDQAAAAAPACRCRATATPARSGRSTAPSRRPA